MFFSFIISLLSFVQKKHLMKKRNNQFKQDKKQKIMTFLCHLQRLLELLIQAQIRSWQKGAPTGSSSSWSTFAKMLGKLVVSSVVGIVKALASHHQFVMNAMFAHEPTDTDIEKQQSLSTVVMSTSSFSNFIQDVLAQPCTELSILKQLPSRPSHPWRISPAWSTSGRVREQVFCFLSRLGALGNCCSHVNIFGTAGIDAPPFDSYHTARRVPSRRRQAGPRGCHGSCFSGSSDAVAADKVQLTSSDETSRQMYPLTRSSGTLCVACCYAHELDSQQ